MSETAVAPEVGSQAHREASLADLSAKISAGAFGTIAPEQNVPASTVDAPPAVVPPAAEPETPRGDDGRFQAATPAPEAAPAASTVSATQDGSIVLKGPWGERKLDPQKAEDRAALIEFGQKGANYERLVNDMDTRAAKRADELANQRVFETYLSAGLIEVDASGQTKYTEKGQRTLFPQPGTGAPAAAQSDEVDSLIRAAVRSEDPEAAEASLKALVTKMRFDPDAVQKQVDSLLQQREAAAAQQRAAQETTARVRAQFEAAVAKFPVIAEIPGGVDHARGLVQAKLREFAELQQRNDPTVPRGEAAFEAALAEVAQLGKTYQGLRAPAPQAPRRAAPPATGGGSAAPPAGVATPQARPSLESRGKLAHATEDVMRFAKQFLGK